LISNKTVKIGEVFKTFKVKINKNPNSDAHKNLLAHNLSFKTKFV